MRLIATFALTMTALLLFDASAQPLTGINDADYLPPFPLTAKFNKLTIKIDRPQLSPEEIQKLESAMKNAALGIQ